MEHQLAQRIGDGGPIKGFQSKPSWLALFPAKCPGHDKRAHHQHTGQHGHLDQQIPPSLPEPQTPQQRHQMGQRQEARDGPHCVWHHLQWDHSLVGDQLGAHPGMESAVWDEVLIANAGRMDAIYGPALMLGAGAVYVLLSLLAVAGALPLYAGLDLKFNWERFWSDASRYFRPFLGLAVVAAFLFLAADWAAELVDALIAESVAGSNDEPMLFTSSVLLSGGLRFGLFALIVMVFQYAKAIAAARQVRNIFFLVRRAFAFVSRHFLAALLLFSMFCLLELGINALDIAVWHFLLPGADTLAQWAWLAFVTALLVVNKLAFFAGQLLFYTETRRRADEHGSISIAEADYAAEY